MLALPGWTCQADLQLAKHRPRLPSCQLSGSQDVYACIHLLHLTHSARRRPAPAARAVLPGPSSPPFTVPPPTATTTPLTHPHTLPSLQLVRRGGVELDVAKDLRFFDFGQPFARGPSSLTVSPRADAGQRGHRHALHWDSPGSAARCGCNAPPLPGLPVCSPTVLSRECATSHARPSSQPVGAAAAPAQGAAHARHPRAPARHTPPSPPPAPQIVGATRHLIHLALHEEVTARNAGRLTMRSGCRVAGLLWSEDKSGVEGEV